MEQAAAIIGISGIIILLLNIANQKTTHFGSDHYFHLNIIRLIQHNKHRFVKNYENFIGNNHIAYPQLFHWVLSFFKLPPAAGLQLLYKTSLFFADLIFFLVFFYSGFLNFSSKLPLLIVFLYAALLFIFTPFNFVRWNAHNAGFSPRSLGVLLGRVFIYLFLFHLYHSGWIWYAALVFISYIIFISSQFAAQYVLFFCLLYGIAFLQPAIAAIPLLGFFLFYLFHGKLAIQYIKGQYQHKKIYAQHFAQRFILKYRPSIWRDFVYDFWVKLKKEKAAAFPYIQTNALLTLCWGFTMLPAVLYFFIHLMIQAPNQNAWLLLQQNPLLQVIVISLCIFILTSFAKTRFLGEPERYLEFATPTLVFLFMQCYSSEWVYNTIIYYVLASLFLIFISKWYDKKSTKAKENMLWHLDTPQENGQSILSVLHSLQKDTALRIFSNNEEITRRLLIIDKAEFLLPDIAAEKTGSFYYKDIFPDQYPQVNENLLLPMIKEFDINILVLDISLLSKPYAALLTGLSFKPVFTLNDFVLLQKQ